MIAAQRRRFLELGDFNVMTGESSLLCFNDGGRQEKKKRRRAKLYIKVSGGSAL